MYSRANNSKPNRLHERCSQIIYSDTQSLFETLLEKDRSVYIHYRNLQIHATEMYEIKNDLSPLIVTELFEQHCDLTNNTQVTIAPTRTVFHRSESISFIGPKI